MRQAIERILLNCQCQVRAELTLKWICIGLHRFHPAQEENAMLVLSRKRGERIVIGPNIELTVVDICGNKVRLAFDAPRDVSIHRQEIYRRIQDESHHEVQYKGSKKMTKLQILALVALTFVMLAPDAMAQRRGGGAVSGGMRGAVVGGMVGGESGATCLVAKIGVVTEAVPEASLTD